MGYRGDVTLTDLPETMAQLKLNLKKNEEVIKDRGSIKAEVLDWNENVKMEPYDFILAADCVYYSEVSV